ncbi:bifunctional MFS transporter/dTMP kinase [Actinophytocola algeriensis]|uniref:Thymidylate kinase n=1 Tax=Actinophytocola algeriensis TaxID=1768010 RepID=A0A7W7Q506_9PSEU|nr:dTMP kinase [Actinophytocola algeriensis]MBE1478673.1 dTMP kinase [Actinophytocola algeriensis]
MAGIIGGASTEPDGGARSPAESNASITHRARSVLAIRGFRRLWGVTYLCSIGDWLSLLALTSLVTKMTDGYSAASFAFAGVVLTQLLPGLLFAPLGGLFADRFDRRKVMVVCDVLRCALFVSIALVGTPLWLFVANFLIGCCSMMWIPSKDAAVPNLLRRSDQVETAAQLGLVMTYGIAAITGAGLYAIITGITTNLNLQPDPEGLGMAKIIVVVVGALYLTSALLIATRIPELSSRDTPLAEARKAEKKAAEESGEKLGFGAMVRDAGRFVRTTPLVRGLLIGMVGAFAAAGALIGSANLYASSLRGGASTFGLLMVAMFIGLATGMAGAPKLARRLPHNRLFGIAIVLAGVTLVLVALSPHLFVSLITVMIVGACAGAAFLTGVTIIGTQIEDAIRGRINAIYQALMKVILAGALALTPLLVGLVQPHKVIVWGREMTIDGTRPVLLGAGLIAALVGVIAYRQMDDRRTEPILADLLNAIRGKPRRSTGLLVAVEADIASDTSTQARLLADWLKRPGAKEVLLATDPALDDQRLRAVLSGAQLTGARAHALVAAAVRADIVERQIRPALDRGALVVMERFVDSPLAHLSAAADLDPAELEGLADWATARLRPDVTILLDRDPSTLDPTQRRSSSTDHWQVQKVLTEMAAADPDRYVVVDADGTPEQVAVRVRIAVQTALAGRRLGSLVPSDSLAPVEVRAT